MYVMEVREGCILFTNGSTRPQGSELRCEANESRRMRSLCKVESAGTTLTSENGG